MLLFLLIIRETLHWLPIEEHFSKTHSVHGLLLGLSEFWKSALQLHNFYIVKLYFSCKEVGFFFTRMSSWDGVKQWKFFVNINLVTLITNITVLNKLQSYCS